MHLLIGRILRSLINIFFISLCVCCTCSNFASTTLTILPYHGDNYIINGLATAKNDIQITMYGFTDQRIAASLIRLKQRGIKVRLLIEQEPYKSQDENLFILKKLKNAGVTIHYASSKFTLTHQKTILIDHAFAFILTDNLTYSGLYRQRNFILQTDDKKIIDELNKLFNADWKQIPYSAIAHSALVLSPENSWQKLHQLIINTKANLDIYAAALTDKRIVADLIARPAKIRILVDKKSKVFNIAGLCQHHIEIHALKQPEQHAKALLRDYHTDNQLAYVGSANLTYPGLSKNREAGLLFSDTVAIKKLHGSFEHDWQNSSSLCDKSELR